MTGPGPHARIAPMRKLYAEAFGTFALVFAGTGAIVIDDVSGGAITHVGVALTFGLIIVAMIAALGDVSGAHLNPAVTLGFFAAGRFEGNAVLPYLVAQISGALAASGMLRLLFPENAGLGATLPAGSAGQSFVLEFFLTWILMFVILAVATGGKERGVTAGIAIGSVVGLEALFAGPISGASMNPARSLAPALVSGQLGSLWIYLAAPVAGAIAAVGASRLIFGAKASPIPNPDSLMKRFLFVCIHNSARSQMAEAFLNRCCPGECVAESAGLEPGSLNPVVVKAMSEIGIDLSQNRTKSVAEMLEGGTTYTHVVTVCDEASAERCPVFPGGGERLHWGFPDPSALSGTEDERLPRVREIRDRIREEVESWCAGHCSSYAGR